MTAQRKRGPRKGDGGRPAYTLVDDPDRFVIVAALWFGDDRKGRRAYETLQALDFLLTRHDISLEVAPDLVQIPGLGARRVLSLTNPEPSRRLARNSPARRPHSAPGGAAFRRSRLQLLREKVDRYSRAKLTKREVWFRDVAWLGLDFVAHGRLIEAAPVFAAIGWQIDESVASRLLGILSGLALPPQLSGISA